MKRRVPGVWGLGLAATLCVASACETEQAPATLLSGCGSDADCKGDRVCESGLCVSPSGEGADGTASSTGAGDDGASETGVAGTSDTSGTQSDGESGGVPEGGGTPVDDPELEQACMRDCDARAAAACEMDLSQDQCYAHCLVRDEANRGFCLDELSAQYSCLGSGGYTCVQGYPRAQSTCIAENLAYSECAQRIPCWDFCAAEHNGCKASEEACVTSCETELDGVEDAYSCQHDWQQLLSCWTWDDSFACGTDAPEVGGCGDEVGEVAECLNREESCLGFCWAAELLGCGEGCLADCQAKSDHPSCGRDHDRLVECAAGYDGVRFSCEAGAPAISDDCMSNMQDWQDCLDRN